MKTINWFKHKPNLLLLIVLLTTGTLSSLPAFSQIDYSYGLNKKGFRLGIGGGVTVLNYNLNSQDPTPSFFSSLDYNFNPYLSIGAEGSIGKLKEIDHANKYFYQSSVSAYYTYDINVKFGVGLFYDFDSKSALQDAIKRFYVGGGYGLTTRSFKNSGTSQTYGLFFHQNPNYAKVPEANTTDKTLGSYVFDLGTNIDLRGVLGNDKIEINPNYQLNWMTDFYLDGIKNTGAKYHGLYNVFSVSVKYKF